MIAGIRRSKRTGRLVGRFATAALLTALVSVFSTVSIVPASAAPEDLVVARVGESTITAGDLTRRLQGLPRIQLMQFGQTKEQIRRAFLEKVMIPELLLSQGATAKKMNEVPGVRVKLLDAERSAMLHAIRKEQVDSGAVSDAEAQKYYDQNRDKFQTAERVQIWRILVATPEEAQKIIDEVKAPGSEKRWAEIARERSLDKTTSERAGNLGFLQPDGQSNEPSIKAEPVLVVAAKKVKDGELLMEPVKESKGFGVVWRRGTLPAIARPFELESAQIKQTLGRQKSEGAVKILLEQLRKDNVSEVNESLLGLVEVTSNADIVPVQRKPGTKPKAPGRPRPSPSPQGSR